MNKILLSSFLTIGILFAGDYTNSIGMKFKDIPSGSFEMGTSDPNCPKYNSSTDTQKQYKNYKKCIDTAKTEPPKYVSVNSFYMQETEVTQGQWNTIMGTNPAMFKVGNEDMPVEQVSFNDVVSFIGRLNYKDKTTTYALPTEIQWEYAARARTATKWYCGDEEACVGSISVYNTDIPSPVKSKEPNLWGLYDMSGNVSEWINKGWSSRCDSRNRSSFPVYDFQGDSVASNTGMCDYVDFRGGSWKDLADTSRSAARSAALKSHKSDSLGFRLVINKF